MGCRGGGCRKGYVVGSVCIFRPNPKLDIMVGSVVNYATCEREISRKFRAWCGLKAGKMERDAGPGFTESRQKSDATKSEQR